MGYSFKLAARFFYMHNPTDRITHTTAFVTPVVGHWLEREIAQWVHHEWSIRRPITPWTNALNYHGATSRSYFKERHTNAHIIKAPQTIQNGFTNSSSRTRKAIHTRWVTHVPSSRGVDDSLSMGVFVFLESGNSVAISPIVTSVYSYLCVRQCSLWLIRLSHKSFCM